MCIDPTRSRVHSNFIFNAAYDWMARWLNGERPPSMPEPNSRSINRNTGHACTRRIRNRDRRRSIARCCGACGYQHRLERWGQAADRRHDLSAGGTFIAFDDTRLRSLYTSHADYVAKVAAAANVNVQQGFLLSEDAGGTRG